LQKKKNSRGFFPENLVTVVQGGGEVAKLSSKRVRQDPVHRQCGDRTACRRGLRQAPDSTVLELGGKTHDRPRRRPPDTAASGAVWGSYTNCGKSACPSNGFSSNSRLAKHSPPVRGKNQKLRLGPGSDPAPTSVTHSPQHVLRMID